MKQLNQNEHAQTYTDDIIIQSNKIKNIQNYYEHAKTKPKEIPLEINPEKCELIRENETEEI